jgi:hypothetical protein
MADAVEAAAARMRAEESFILLDSAGDMNVRLAVRCVVQIDNRHVEST